MALVEELIAKENHTRSSVHAPVEASYVVFENEGQTYLQIDTYGSPDRAVAKVSQSLQFGPESLAKLKQLLAEIG